MSRSVWIIELWWPEYEAWRPYFAGPFSSRAKANVYRRDNGLIRIGSYGRTRVVKYVPVDGGRNG